jgi:hypothetical protein
VPSVHVSSVNPPDLCFPFCTGALSAVTISVSKDGVKFSTTGDIGAANITCRQNTSVDKEEQTIIELQAGAYTRSFQSSTSGPSGTHRSR